MSKRCIICKKELSADNKGFLCQYHKDKGAEYAKKAGATGAAVVAFAATAGKQAYEHKDEILAVGKKVVTIAADIVKKTL